MRHAFREQETPNSDPAKHSHNTHIGAHSVTEGMAAFNAQLPDKYRKDAVLAIEYLVTASPEAMHAKTREQQDQYFYDALEWLRSKHGVDQVIYAGIHRDETTPHMYAYVVPRDPDTGRLNCKKWLGGAKALNQMQTDFAELVGQRHGLKRGIEGSKAKHQRVSQFYAAIQQEPTHVDLKPEQLKPEVLKKGLFSSVYETPEAQAERLSKWVQKHYSPIVITASVAQQEARRAREMTKTAEGLGKRLEVATERLRGFDRIFEGLTTTDAKEVAKKAIELRKKREIEAEQKRRVDMLQTLVRTKAGAAYTFAKNAIEAMQGKFENWRRVDWAKVEEKAIHEAVNEHRQSMRSVVEAIMKYSPAQADKTSDQIKTIVAEVEARTSTLSQPTLRKNHGPSPSR
ncbi:hypothetical protein GCM10009425_49020 [Pseudomonas asuensis]|uniref:Plasmid recombination enzyme n=2 Tax=Pseudomonas asuensis TaxID=1825787 RepID=A0ABQ2H3Q2_9PSED|nr:hypothetical protein GCM10009425_49020 [Pseudomonas asuensis]